MSVIGRFWVKYKSLLILFLILFSALVLRLFLAPTGYHVDIYSNAGWGEWIWENGPQGFYEHNEWVYSWPTQPPLVSQVYGWSYEMYTIILRKLVELGSFIGTHRLAPTKFMWLFEFTQWFDDAVTLEIPFQNGFLISIKLFPIFADILIAGLIYYFAYLLKAKNKLIWSAIFLFSPFSFYLSALWGQYDQIGFLFLFLSLLTLKRFFIVSPLLFALSIMLKPTALIFVPVYLWFIYLRKPGLSEFLISIIITVIVGVTSIKSFSGDRFWLEYLLTDLNRIIFSKSEPRVTTNALNFWHIIIGPRAINHNNIFLLLPYKYFGYLAAFILNAMAIYKTRKINAKLIAFNLFFIGLGSWLFMTNMLDRYAYAGLMGGLLLSIYDRKLFKYWIILSLIYFVNLYRGWWFPESLSILKEVLEYQNGIVGRLLSVLNTLIFLIMARIVVKNNEIFK